MEDKMNLLIMKQPQCITAKLERIVRYYRDDMEDAMERVNSELEDGLTRLVEEFGFEAISAAVETIEGDLSIDFGLHTYVWEALDCASTPKPNEECENNIATSRYLWEPTEGGANNRPSTMHRIRGSAGLSTRRAYNYHPYQTRNGDKTMTIAEAADNAIETNPDGDNWEIMEDVSKSLFDHHRMMNDGGDIVGFKDGSFYSFDPNITDGDANRFFSSRADLMESIDAHNSALDYTSSSCAVEGYSGVVRGSGDRIDTLELTDIVDASGKCVEFGSTERYDVPDDSCYIEYRTDLAAAIGKCVRIMAREDSYVADGCSPNGVPFTYKEPVLLDVTLLEVMPSTPELQTMESAENV